MRKLLVSVTAIAALAVGVATGASSQEAPPVTDATRSVLFVANNWDGTAHIIDPHTFQKLGEPFNVIPDIEERLAEIYKDPERTGYFLAIRQLVGEGHDQWADDMFSSHDGTMVFISRPSLADVIGMRLSDKTIAWRYEIEGQRADHMAISPDGKHVMVSDSTANKVHVIDTATGKRTGEFASGDSPHENNYVKNGTQVYHASIGLVYTPADQPIFDSTKGERFFQVVEAGSNKILKRLVIGDIMAANGYPNMSSAVRPMAVDPTAEDTVYMQLSFFHGFVKFDLATDKPVKVVDLPKKTSEPREGYLLDSAHHGLSISADGKKLCAAGTMDGYGAIVATDKDPNVPAWQTTLIEPIDKPYWSTNSADGEYCFMSASGSDEVVVIRYSDAKQVARIPVGDHPQRMRMGVIRKEYVGGTAARIAPPVNARLRVLSARLRRGRLALRLRVDARASGRVTARVRAGKRSARLRFALPRRHRGKPFAVSLRLPRSLRSARRATVELAYGGTRTVRADRARATART